jgi:hypothetical protein
VVLTLVFLRFICLWRPSLKAAKNPTMWWHAHALSRCFTGACRLW